MLCALGMPRMMRTTRILSAKGRALGGRDWLAGWLKEFTWVVMFQAHLCIEASMFRVGVGEEGAGVIGVGLA